MQNVEFRTVEQEFGLGGLRPAIVPHLNGVPLPELVRRAGLPAARRAGGTDLADDYAGLIEKSVRWPSRHYLGAPVLSAAEDGDTALLGCRCGSWGCRPFTARVTVTDHTVTWSGYRTGHRDRDPGLPDFVFDRDQYEQAVRATAR